VTQPQAPVDTEPVTEIGTVAAVLAAAEIAVASYMLASYTKWLAQVAAQVLAGFERFGVAPNPAEIWSTVPSWNRIVDGLMDRLMQLARAGWIDASRQLGVDLPFNPDDTLLMEELRRTRNLMVRTPDEVYRMIVRELGTGVAAGEKVTQLATRVRHALDVNGVENWAARARTVAVTEVHRAYNMGALAAGLRVSVRGAAVMKTWRAKDDSRTRPAHDRADGQTVPINQPFIVNMEPLRVPGDSSGSPANVINCRCKAIFRR
jgi:F like protein